VIFSSEFADISHMDGMLCQTIRIPPATQPLYELGNVIMTPHVSGWTEGMLN
jgi:lactate dehydrogenase-like 2-hydroxyacid dehydrogenase